MPLPIAHGLMGASMVAAFRPHNSLKHDWKFLLLGAFLGILPDFDYALSWLRVGGRTWHHDFTHSILFAFLTGLITAAVINHLNFRGHFSFRDVMTYFLAMLSHPILDFLFTESRGVELFWPFSGKLFKFGLQPPLSYNWRLRPLSAKITDIVELCLFELAVFTSILLMILWVKGRIWLDQEKI
ncbi:MAG: metal-dependent hydrolase [Blastocatellales bacterium]